MTTTHKKRKAATRKKTIQGRGDRLQSFDADTAREAFNTPGTCGDCGASVPLVFHPEMALDAPNGFVIPGFGKCACGCSVMSLVGPPQPDNFIEVMAGFLGDAFPENEASSVVH